MYEERWNVCSLCGARRLWPRPLFIWTNQRAETVSTRPQRPIRGKTKPRITSKLTFHSEPPPQSAFLAQTLHAHSIAAAFRRSLWASGRCCLSVVRGGGLETAIACPISSLVFLLSPGFSMLLLKVRTAPPRHGGAVRRDHQ